MTDRNVDSIVLNLGIPAATNMGTRSRKVLGHIHWHGMVTLESHGRLVMDVPHEKPGRSLQQDPMARLTVLR